MVFTFFSIFNVENTCMTTSFGYGGGFRFINKGNKSKLIIIQTDKISQQPENCENRNDPDLVQAFIKLV